MVLPRRLPEPHPNFDIPAWQVADAILEDLGRHDRALKESHPLLDDEPTKRVMTSLFALGRLEAQEDLDTASPDYRQATELATNAAKDYWYARGKEGFLALGLYISEAFVDAIEAALRSASQAHQPIRAWLHEHRESPDARRLAQYGGNFVDHALRWGLITRQNQIAPGARRLIQVHFKLRWCRFVNDIMDYTMLLEPEELKLLWRFRIAGDLSLSMKRRQIAWERLKRLSPDYPIHDVLGAIYARRGQYREALTEYRKAAGRHPQDQRIAENIRFLHLARQQQPVVPAPR